MRKISYEEYFDKVLGGWIGKSLGGTIGFFEGTKEITHFNIYELLPDGLVPNDDLDIQLVWLDVLLDKGIYFTSSQLMEAWIEEYDYNFGEYAYGRRNYLRGIKPPVSGSYGNDYYKTGMGCPIRSEVWGMICPGNPDLAAEYAYKDGILDHEGESVWAQQFLAAVEAEAFFEKNLMKLIQTGLNYVPTHSQLYECINDAIKHFNSGLAWQDTWRKLKNQHSHPDCTYAPFNLGIIIMALLYGRGSFEEALTIAVNSGWDIDCTCSSTAAILGIISGRKGFEKKWLDYAGDKVVTLARPSHPMDSLSTITGYICRAGTTIVKEGLSKVVLDSIPEDIELLPACRYEKEVEIDIDYEGYPAVGINQSKSISLWATNRGNGTYRGTLKLQLPDGWKSNKEGSTLNLLPGEQIKVQYSLLVPADITRIKDTNLLTASFTANSGERWTNNFGLCGTPVARVLGPYFDAYNDWLDRNKLEPYRILKTPSQEVAIPDAGEEWGNHRVDIDKEYIEENFADQSLVRQVFQEGARVNIFDDRYAVRDVFKLHGPCCVYYYQEVYSPVSRKAQLFLGSSDPFKLWFNGKLIFKQNENRFWFCNNDVVDVDLSKGLNYIVLKVVRKGNDNRLSMVFRHKPALKGYDSAPFITDLSYGTL